MLLPLLAIFGPLLFLLAVGFICGKTADRRHTQQLASQFAETEGMLVTSLKTYPLCSLEGHPPQMVAAEVVVATDYVKSFLAAWTAFFGGEVSCYQGLMTRARLDALARLQLQAKQLGYNAICNVRFLSADVAGATNRRAATAVAMIAQGTAYHATLDG